MDSYGSPSSAGSSGADDQTVISQVRGALGCGPACWHMAPVTAAARRRVTQKLTSFVPAHSCKRSCRRPTCKSSIRCMLPDALWVRESFSIQVCMLHAATGRARPPTLLLTTHEVKACSKRTQTVRDKCFDKCVTKPSTSLGSSEQQCIARCADRYSEVGAVLLCPSATAPALCSSVLVCSHSVAFATLTSTICMPVLSSLPLPPATSRRAPVLDLKLSRICFAGDPSGRKGVAGTVWNAMSRATTCALLEQTASTIIVCCKQSWNLHFSATHVCAVRQGGCGFETPLGCTICAASNCCKEPCCGMKLHG